MLTLQGKNLQSMQTIQVDLEVISATYVFIEILLQNFMIIALLYLEISNPNTPGQIGLIDLISQNI